MFESIGVVLVTAFITWHIAAKRFVVENIDRERTKWREEVRGIAECVHDAMVNGDEDGTDLNRLRNKLRIRLNPYHYKEAGRDDGEIIESVLLPPDVDPLDQAEEFSYRIALLLKHDWDRAKHNVKLRSFLPWWGPRRVPYHEWLRNMSSS